VKTFLWDLEDILIVAHAETEAEAREVVRKKLNASRYPIEAIVGFRKTAPKVLGEGALNEPYATWRWS
jgi:hypothetical protein